MHGEPRRVVIPLLLAALACAQAAPGQESVTVRDPGTFVVDKAKVIDSGTKARMERMLAELEQRTTAQVKVLTVPTTGGESVFDFAQRHATAWKLGQQKKDNGVLIVLAMKEHDIWIHVGYGLEPILPDSWCGTESRDIAKRYFKSGQFSQGMDELTGTVAARIAEASNVSLPDHPAAAPMPGRSGPAPVVVRHASGGGGGCCCVGLVVLIILLSILGRGARYNRGSHGWFWFLLGMLLSPSHSRRSDWGGRGFGGGFGSGFGGGGFGGGGHFGGGGSFGGGGGGAKW
jgi:uncharacterized protein